MPGVLTSFSVDLSIGTKLAADVMSVAKVTQAEVRELSGQANSIAAKLLGVAGQMDNLAKNFEKVVFDI